MSDQLVVPEGIHLVPMPPYSPELQPAERLWPLVNEVLANQAFESIRQVEELVYQRCRRLLQQPDLIRRSYFLSLVAGAQSCHQLSVIMCIQPDLILATRYGTERLEGCLSVRQYV